MAINFPTSLDVFTDPTASDQLNLPSHSGQHTDLNNAVEALEAKVGADSSAVTSSHDYKIAQLEALGTWDTWTPSYGNLSGGTTTTARYVQIGKLVTCVWVYTCAGADVSGAVTVSLPVTAASSCVSSAVGTARFNNVGVDVWEGRATLDSTTTVQVRRLIDDSGSTKLRPISSTLPFTWGATDILQAFWTYEAA